MGTAGGDWLVNPMRARWIRAYILAFFRRNRGPAKVTDRFPSKPRRQAVSVENVARVLGTLQFCYNVRFDELLNAYCTFSLFVTVEPFLVYIPPRKGSNKFVRGTMRTSRKSPDECYCFRALWIDEKGCSCPSYSSTASCHLL
jgi:hypothetical protein